MMASLTHSWRRTAVLYLYDLSDVAVWRFSKVIRRVSQTLGCGPVSDQLP